MSNGDPPVDEELVGVKSQQEFADALKTLRSRSAYSFKAIAAELDRPTTTVHGWFSGRHLPYQRDNDDVQRLLQLLDADDPSTWMSTLADVRRFEASRSNGPGNPFKGLLPYEPEDASRFFGRATETADLVERVGEGTSRGPLVVIGASGSGKSSLLRAGLVPALDGRESVVVAPGSNALDTLCELSENPSVERVVVVDQFEELFTSESSEVGEFLDGLEALGERSFDIVIGLRDDFFDHASRWPWLLLGLRFRQFVVAPPDSTAIPELIVGPASQASLTVDSDLVAELTQCTTSFLERGERIGTLPLLSFVLFQMAERAPSSALTLDGFEELGGFEAVVSQAAERAYASLPPASADRCAQLFKQLVQIGHETIPTRRTIELADVEQLIADDADLDDVLAAFTGERILVADRDTVRISHETLLVSWPRLAGWIDEERESLSSARQVRLAGEIWVNSGFDEASLLTGAPLERARSVAGDPAGWLRLNTSARDFVDRSAQQELDRAVSRRRRFRSVVALAAVATIAAIGATVLGFQAQSESDRANDESRRATEAAQQAVEQAERAERNADRSLALRLAAESVVVREQNPALAVALAAESSALTDDVIPEAVRALVGARLEFGQRLGQAIGRPLTGHSNRVWTIAVSPQTSVIASGSDDTTIRLWDGGTGEQIGATLEGHTDSIRGLAFSPDGTVLASASRDLTVRLWDVETGEQIGEPFLGHSGEVRTVAFHPTRSVLASGGADNSIRLWDLDTLEEVEVIDDAHESDIWMLRFHPDGDVLASASADTTVAFWSTDTWSAEGDPIVASDEELRDLAYSPDGDMLATVGRDFLVRRWDATTREPLGEPMAGHESAALGVTFSPDGTILVSVSDDATMRFWDSATGEVLGQPLRAHLEAVRGVGYTSDGSLLVTGSSDQTLQRWDPVAGEPLGRALLGHEDRVLSVDASDDGSVMATGSQDATVRLWDPSTGAPLGAPLVGHDGPVFDVTVSPDGNAVASVGADATVRIWSVATGDLVVSVPDVSESPLRSVDFSPDGLQVATGGGDSIGRLWDATTGDLLAELEGHSEQIWGLAYSADGARLATASADELVIVWDVELGTQLGSPLVGHTAAVFGVAFDRSGERLATSGNDRTIRLWDLATEEEVIEPMRGHRGRAWGLEFTADDEYLVSAGLDGTVRLFDPVTGQAVGDPLTDHDDRVIDVAVLPGDRSFVSVSWDGTVRMWFDPLDATEACANVERYVEPDQVSDFLPDGREAACR